jgi:hypothetical protein
MVASAKDWKWGSYRATTGQTKGPDCLKTEWILAVFAKRKSVAIEKYKQFVSEGKGQPSPWALLKKQIYLGSEQFVDEMQSLVNGDKELDEIPSSQRRPTPKSLVEYESSSGDRNSAIVKAYQSGG